MWVSCLFVSLSLLNKNAKQNRTDSITKLPRFFYCSQYGNSLCSLKIPNTAYSPWNAIFFFFQCAHRVLAVYSQCVHLRSLLSFVRHQRSQSAHRAFTKRSPNVQCSLIVQSQIIIFRLYTFIFIYFIFKIFIFFTKRSYIVHCAIPFHFVLVFALRLRSKFAHHSPFTGSHQIICKIGL